MVERARELQQNYWTPNSAEKNRLASIGLDQLDWDQTMRLIHLTCLELVSQGPVKQQLESETAEAADAPHGEDFDLLSKLVGRVASASSPYRSRHVAVWNGEPGESANREADSQGDFRNASLTHMGCLEVIRLDADDQPATIEFIPLDSLRGAVFAAPALYRYGKLFFDDGRPDEIVLVPLLYGMSWLSPNSFDHDGSMTRFIGKITLEQESVGIGIGHQDFVVDSADERTLVGLGSIGELMIALAIDDVDFERKCRARGLDPTAVRKSME